MSLTTEMLRSLLREYIGVEFDPEEVQRLKPLVDRQVALMRELHALDLGAEDPRAMHYADDRRLLP